MKNIASVIDKIPFLNNHSAFIVNILTSMTGGITAQAISFLCAPAIARLFTPEHFGVAALVASLGSIFVNASTFGYNQAIILPKEDTDSVKIMTLCLIILISLCVFLTLCSIFIDVFFIERPWFKNLGGWIFAVPISIFLSGFTNIFAGWNVRKKRYTVIAKSQILAAIVSPSIKIGAGIVTGSSVFALIAGQLIGAMSRIGVLVNEGKKTIIKDIFKAKRYEIYHIAKEYRDFPFYGMPAALLTGFSNNIVVIMLGYFFSPVVIGFYAMGTKLIRMPLSFLVVSVRRVYMQKIAELKNQGQPLSGPFIKTTAGLFLIGCVPFLIIVLWGKEIISLLLGDSWALSGTYVAILSPWLFSTFIITPSIGILITTRNNRFRFYYQFFSFILKISSLYIGLKLYDEPEPSLLIVSLTSAAVNLSLIVICFWIVRKLDHEKFV